VRTRRRILLLALAVLAVTAAVVGGFATSSGNAAHRAAAVRVALVTDTGSLNDKGFNTLAAAGLKRAEDKLGIDGRIYITQTAADRTPNLAAAAQQGFDLVIGVGVLFAFGPLPTVSKAFPKTMFAGVDVAQGDMGGAIPNVRGIQFAEQQAGCLVGNIAALEAQREKKLTIAALGANKVTAIVRFMAGYKYCALRVSKKMRVLTNYANDPTFNDPAKCKAAADSQIARGARVIFQIAGGCGLGALDAAKSAGIWGIGVDADQSFLGPHILTSARKRVDEAVFDTIAEFQKDPAGFKGGIDKHYDLKNQGVGFGKLSTKLPLAVRRAYTKSTNALGRLIIQGKVTPPTFDTPS
jgi:basic membrane protein A and related proteins